jgi:phosphatidylinositol-3-phosphatase
MRRLTWLFAIVLAAVGLSGVPSQAQPTSVVLIVMENHSISAITPSAAPYMTSFAKGGRLFTNYHEGSSAGPSLSDYIQLTSGLPYCSNDGCPPTLTQDNIFHQLGATGWKSYQESMPVHCDQAAGSGLWARKHAPASYYLDIRTTTCPMNEVAYPSTLPATLAPFTEITPNLCHDMHDCSVAAGDNWLKTHVPGLLSRGAIVLITFDESGVLWTAERGPGVPVGVTDTGAYTHYSTLAGIEDHFGVGRLANAVGKTPLPL